MAVMTDGMTPIALAMTTAFPATDSATPAPLAVVVAVGEAVDVGGLAVIGVVDGVRVGVDGSDVADGVGEAVTVAVGDGVAVG